MKRIKLVTESRLRATEEVLGERCLPRIIRLCRKFKFTENEVSIALYCLIHQFTQKYERIRHMFGHGRPISTGSDCVTISYFMDIPLMEVVGFIREERLHIKQGLFPEIKGRNVLKCQIAYDFDFCKVLMGLKMTNNELEHTLLADLVVEKPGNEHLK